MTTHETLSAPVAAARGGSSSLPRRLVRRALAIAPGETSFARRGFPGDEPEIRRRLEGVAEGFVRGYHAALEAGLPELAGRLDAEPLAARGWAYEGAAMALTILDVLTLRLPFRREGRLQTLLAGPGDPHIYIIHVGAGWALARLPLPVGALLRRLDPLLGWLALDGYGFHQGFFHAAQSVAGQRVPAKVRGYARRAFDQGLGRSLWFVEAAAPERIAAAIGAFPPARRPDLWSGVGLAATYAGGRGQAALAALRRAASPWQRELAQGAAFAAAARQRAGNPTADAELACRVFCGSDLATAAAVSDTAARDLPARIPLAPLAPNAEVPAYEVWRRRIQESF